jgi:hypothetical protein
MYVFGDSKTKYTPISKNEDFYLYNLMKSVQSYEEIVKSPLINISYKRHVNTEYIYMSTLNSQLKNSLN